MTVNRWPFNVHEYKVLQAALNNDNEDEAYAAWLVAAHAALTDDVLVRLTPKYCRKVMDIIQLTEEEEEWGDDRECAICRDIISKLRSRITVTMN